jgi:LCP family protein required for cell wall assembly
LLAQSDRAGTQTLALPQTPILGIPKAKERSKHKHKAKKQRNWRKIIKRSLLGLLVLIIISGAYFFVKGYIQSRKILRGGGSAAALAKEVDITKLHGEGDGRVNIMLLGKGGPGHDGPDLTDTLLIASIDPVSKDAALLSIPRDMWVKTGNSSMKINAVYAIAKQNVLAKKRYANQAEDAERAGLNAIENTMESTFGIPIHYYGMVDFEAFRKAIDTVGGVDITVKEKLYDPTVAWENNWNPLIADVGAQHFNGKKGLLYARSRHGSARGDFDRAQRQREILVALKDKVLSAGTYSNPVKISQLMDAFGDHIRTNFTRNELMRLYELGKDIPSSKISSLGLADPPNVLVETGNVNGQSVVLPKAGVGNYGDIQSFVRNALKDSYIKSENPNIIVMNGTNTLGLASKKADELRSYGYNVSQVSDAPTKNYTQTKLIDMRSGAKKYTKRYLEQRLKVTATSSLPTGVNAGNADFVIILGSDGT